MADEAELLRLQNEQLKLKMEVTRRRRFELLPGLIAMSLISIMGFAVVMLFMVPMPLTEAAGTLAVAMVSAITTNVGVIVGFFFGANKDSKEAQQTIQSMAQTASQAAQASAPAEVAKQVTAAVTAAVAAPTNGADEIKTWDDAVAANTKAAFEGYLAKYPNGVRAPTARTKIASF